MARVFISHSKEDDQGRVFFDKLFGSVEHEGYWYSWEGPTPPHAKTIIEAIKGSASVFVILSKPMENPYTRSWVGYEVGVAAALGKNIWVFEPVEENVSVPVPYVTGYIQYPTTLDEKRVFPYHTLVKSAGVTIPEDPKPETEPRFIRTFCSYEDCKSPYYLFVLGNDFECPVCRKGLKLK